MAVGQRTQATLTTNALDLYLQWLDRSHQLISDARTGMFAILAVDLASLLGLVSVVATLAATNTGKAPGYWWVPGIALIVSSAIAMSSLMRKTNREQPDPAVLLAQALGETSDEAALTSYSSRLTEATNANLKTADALDTMARLASFALVTGLLLVAIPVWVYFGQVFPT